MILFFIVYFYWQIGRRRGTWVLLKCLSLKWKNLINTMNFKECIDRGFIESFSISHYHNYSEQNDSRGPSFETISASGPNAALAHYRWDSFTFLLFLWGFTRLPPAFALQSSGPCLGPVWFSCFYLVCLLHVFLLASGVASYTCPAASRHRALFPVQRRKTASGCGLFSVNPLYVVANLLICIQMCIDQLMKLVPNKYVHKQRRTGQK